MKIKRKTVYVCEKCGTEYATPDIANACEHQKYPKLRQCYGNMRPVFLSGGTRMEYIRIHEPQEARRAGKK